MAFISNRERDEKIKTLHKTNFGKKLYVSLSLILAIALLVLVLIIGLFPIIPTVENSSAFSWVGDGEWFSIDNNLTTYGVIMITLMSVIIFMLISSLIVFLLMKSVKWGFKKTVDLINSPIPGKAGRVSKKAKSIVKKRIEFSNNKNKKK